MNWGDFQVIVTRVDPTQPAQPSYLKMAGKVDLKVVLLGKEYGGKTSLVERYIHGKFNSNAPYQSVSQEN